MAWHAPAGKTQHTERHASVLGCAGGWDTAWGMWERKEPEGIPKAPAFPLERGVDGRLSPNSFFSPVSDFPGKSPSALASAALQANTSLRQEGARGLPEAAASPHSKTSKARSQSIPRPGIEGQIRTRVAQTGKIVPVTSNRQYNKN